MLVAAKMVETAPPQVEIRSESDCVMARKVVRAAATELGFGITDVTRIVTAVSELARNIFVYAKSGVMRWRALDPDPYPGIEIVFTDQGPGIADLDLAMQKGYSSGTGLGMGLPGVRNLMDDMVVETEVGRGTTVRIKKWLRRT